MPAHRVLKLSLVAAAALTALLALAALFALHRIDRSLSSTAGEVRSAKELAFTLRPLRVPPNPGFAPVLARADLRWGVVAGQQVYLAGPGRVVAFGLDGAPIRSFQTGVDLPPYPIAGLGVGRLHNSTSGEVLIATSGAGVLILHPSSGRLDQLLPADPELRDITAVAALPEGDLLLGTSRHGVLRFDGESLTLYRPEYRSLGITAIAVSADAVWVGTQAHGLLTTRGGVTRRLESELPDAHIAALAVQGDEIYAATPDGIADVREGGVVRTLARGTFAQAMATSEHELTVALLEGGTSTVPLPAVHGQIAAPAQTAEAMTREFLRMGADVYAIRADGLYRRTGAVWSPAIVLPPVMLTDNNIAALAFAPDGRLWVGYFDRGLDIVSANTDAVRHLEDDHLFCINRLAVDPVRQTMAAATANGLVLFDRAGVPRQVLARRDGLISEHVTDVAWSPEGSGNVMTLATPAGLTFVSSSGVESLYAFEGLVNNHVYSIAFSADGRLLAGTLGGVSVLEQGSVRRSLSTGNSGLRRNWISALLPLPGFAGGGWLLGMYGGGLMQLGSGGEITTMAGAPVDAVINPNAVLATGTHVFAGSLGDGLWCFGRTSGRWEQITAGLPSLNVTALAAENGELFVGTDNGLVHIMEAQLPA